MGISVNLEYHANTMSDINTYIHRQNAPSMLLIDALMDAVVEYKAIKSAFPGQVSEVSYTTITIKITTISISIIIVTQRSMYIITFRITYLC